MSHREKHKHSENVHCLLRSGSHSRGEMNTLHLLVLTLFTLTGVLSDREWGVNYSEPICAVRGSDVIISCTYFYPKSGHQVERVLWCSMNSNKEKCHDRPYVYDSSTADSGDFNYVGDKKSNCTLLISNVQFSHSGEYKYRFITNVEAGKWTGDPGVTLTVAVLQVSMIRLSGNGTLKEGDSVNLTCAVNCSLSSPQFVWFKNRERLPESGSVLHLPALTVRNSGNYSCTLKNYEDFTSGMISLDVEADFSCRGSTSSTLEHLKRKHVGPLDEEEESLPRLPLATLMEAQTQIIGKESSLFCLPLTAWIEREV
ncbi:uncharacterized protein LOC118798509 [Colossoma macropomum]|uniref:uncharacterized protein LOC118798509 n=1 Tax=Colossoma macropomum TaxID=42526 RepID=UPI001863EF64|nr:uncharacterized protein LOC118798509 [Colossoma macropomum]